MEKPKLYFHDSSPFCRIVLMTLKAINFELELVTIKDVLVETRTPEFLKLNPQHKVPTLDDNGKYIAESHAISVYLVNKYGKPEHQTLAPKNDLYERAVLESRLHFNNTTLVGRMIKLLEPIHQNNSKTLDKEALNSVEEAVGILEVILRNGDYVCGQNLTVADFAIVIIITVYFVLSPIDEIKFPNITGWLNRLSKLPYYDDFVTKWNNAFKETMAKVLNI